MRLKCIGGKANGAYRDLKEGERGIPVYVKEPSLNSYKAIEELLDREVMVKTIWYYRRHLVFNSIDGKINRFEFLSPHDENSVSDFELLRELLRELLT